MCDEGTEREEEEAEDDDDDVSGEEEEEGEEEGNVFVTGVLSFSLEGAVLNLFTAAICKKT